MGQLYRVITEANWQEAQRLGYVLRCGNDNKENKIHLNLPEAVEYTASRYFAEDEAPLVLVIDDSSFSESLEWRDPTATEPWQRPLARIDNLPLSAVIETHRLVPTGTGDSIRLEWAKDQ